jgi:hypothetical protein
MTGAGRQPGGRFAPGTSGNPQGRPSTASRVRQAIERDLVQLGATPEDVENLVEASTDPLRAAAVIAVMAAALAERREQVTHPSGPLT